MTRQPDQLLTTSAAEVLTASTAENFPVALRVLPRALRGELAAVYAYARLVDDVGDGRLDPDPGHRAELLDALDTELELVWDGTPALPVLRALQPVVARHRLPAQPFRDLLAAQRLDLANASYASWDALRDYCRLSADPVGRVVLGLLDVTDAVAVQRSDEVCTALQVLEHLQDVGEDARAGRVYLPQDSLAAAGVAPGDLTAATTSPELRSVVLGLAARARDMLGAGELLTRSLAGAGRVALAGFTAGGLATADALLAAGGDVLPRTVRPGKARTAVHAVRLLAVPSALGLSRTGSRTGRSRSGSGA